MRFSVDSKILQDILNYLTTRPFAEVNVMLQQIQKDAKVIEEALALENVKGPAAV